MPDLTKTCQKCGQTFLIIAMEQRFYRRFGYPEPVNCPNCREERREAMRNPHRFFQQPCGQCGKKIITTYDPKQKWIVFCEKCFADYYNRVDPTESNRAPGKTGKIINP